MAGHAQAFMSRTMACTVNPLNPYEVLTAKLTISDQSDSLVVNHLN